MEDTEAPDPFETVRLLKSDFEVLQKVADYAVADTVALGELLGLERPVEMAPREFFHTVCLPKIAALMRTQGHVDEATAELKIAAARHGNQTKDFGNGTKGLLVGKRIDDPELKARLDLSTSRSERRRIEREMRRGGS